MSKKKKCDASYPDRQLRYRNLPKVKRDSLWKIKDLNQVFHTPARYFQHQTHQTLQSAAVKALPDS